MCEGEGGAQRGITKKHSFISYPSPPPPPPNSSHAPIRNHKRPERVAGIGGRGGGGGGGGWLWKADSGQVHENYVPSRF